MRSDGGWQQASNRVTEHEVHLSPISFFVPALNGGGAQKVVVNLANAVYDLTERPIHVVLVRAEGEFLEELRPEVDVIDLRRHRTSRAIPAFARYLRQTRPAVLCSSLNYANICASIAWQLAGRPCRLVLREDNVAVPTPATLLEFATDSIMAALMRVLYPRADTVVAISKDVFDDLVGRGISKAHKMQLIGNPIDVKASHENFSRTAQVPGTLNGAYICAIGRLTRQKGFDVLLRAFAQIQDRGVHLVILGEGPLRAELEAQAEYLGISDRLCMPGFSLHPERVLCGSSLFVLSSRWEGFGNVLVEALAAGVPIVSTHCPGAPRDLLQDGDLGHLVPTEDPDALAHAMIEALHAPRGTRESRQSRARDFAAPKIAEQYMKEAFGLESRTQT